MNETGGSPPVCRDQHHGGCAGETTYREDLASVGVPAFSGATSTMRWRSNGRRSSTVSFLSGAEAEKAPRGYVDVRPRTTPEP